MIRAVTGRYRDLCAKVDAFFERALAANRAEMRCGPGCSDCCRTEPSVTGVEAAAIREAVPAEVRAALLARPPQPGRCVALEEDGRCAIYAARPLICRSHGLPIRMGGLISSCELNFRKRGPAAADPASILDQQTLSLMLLAVDREHGGTSGERIDLRAAMA